MSNFFSVCKYGQNELMHACILYVIPGLVYKCCEFLCTIFAIRIYNGKSLLFAYIVKEMSIGFRNYFSIMLNRLGRHGFKLLINYTGVNQPN